VKVNHSIHASATKGATSNSNECASHRPTEDAEFSLHGVVTVSDVVKTSGGYFSIG